MQPAELLRGCLEELALSTAAGVALPDLWRAVGSSLGIDLAADAAVQSFLLRHLRRHPLVTTTERGGVTRLATTQEQRLAALGVSADRKLTDAQLRVLQAVART